MNVLYILSETTPSYGGIGAYTYKIIKGISSNNKDFNVVLVTCNQNKKDSFSHYFKDNKNVKVISLFNKEFKQLFLRDIYFQFSIYRNLKRIIEEEEIDLIHHQSGHYDLFLAINFLDQIPKIMTSHGDTYTLLAKWKKANLNNINERINSYLGKLLFHEEKHLYKKSTSIISVADHVRKNLVNHYDILPEKITTIFNLVYPDEFNFNPGNFKPPYKIGFIGRPYYIKGFQDLLYTLNNKNNPDIFEWYIVSDSMKIKQSVKQIRNIHFIDYIPQSKLSEFYNDLDFMFIPSISEACPTVLIESLLKGKLCIARDIVGIREVAKNANLSYFEKIAELNLDLIIQHYLKDKEKFNNVLKENRKIIEEQYCPKKILYEINEMYKTHIINLK